MNTGKKKRRTDAPPPSEPVELEIGELSREGRGVARCEGKAVFVDGALPGERVECRIHARHARHDEAEAVAILRPSPARSTPACAHFGRCGGCALQHCDGAEQTRQRQRQLADMLARIGRVAPDRWLPAVTGAAYGYRDRARLAIIARSDGAAPALGFRVRGSSRIEAISRCPVLHPELERLLAPLQTLFGRWSTRPLPPEVWIARGDAPGHARAGIGLVLPALPASADLAALDALCTETGASAWVGCAADAPPLWQSAQAGAGLAYRLPDGDVTIGFLPWQFTQSNRALNEALVRLAGELLAPTPADSLLDLYCGLGNFALPLARRVARVTGVEGSAAAVDGARRNAVANGIANAEFLRADLAIDPGPLAWARRRHDLVLLDPPRSGAAAMLPLVARCGARALVYVSCDAATLARDAGALVREHGFRLRAAGLLDMFPQTAHFESIALFTAR